MFKKLIAAGATLAVALGIVALATVPAQAHTGDITATAVCNPQTGQYDVTVKLAIANTTLDGNSYWKVGNTTFEGTPSASTPHFANGPVHSTGNPSTITLGTAHLPGTTTGAPWVYAETTFSDNYFVGSDGQTNDLKGDCGLTVTPGSVTHNPGVCTGPGTWSLASYTIPSGNGAYKVQENRNGKGFADVAAGPHTDAHNGDTFQWKAVPLGSTHLTTTDLGTWTAVTPTGDQCDQAVPLPTVTTNPAVCAAPGQPGSGTVTISPINGGVNVSYSTTGKNGTYTTISTPTSQNTVVTVPAQGSVWVQISGKTGYTVPSSLKEYNVGGPTASACVTPKEPTITQAVCNVNNPGEVPEASYTIPNITGVVFTDGSNNVLSAGKHVVTVGTTDVVVVIHAGPDTQNGYLFPTGTPVPVTYTETFTHLSSAGCVLGAANGVPTFDDSRCELPAHPGQSFGGDYVLPNATGVTYHVSVNGAAATVKAPDTYPASAGDKVVVTETAQDGFTLDGGYPVGGYSHTFGPDAGDCLQPVTASATADPQTCAPDSDGFAVFTDGAIVVTVLPHVVGYTINGTPVDMTKAVNGKVTVTEQPGTYLVAVQTETGYTVAGFPKDGKSVTVDAAEVCGQLPSHALVTPTFTPNEAGCFTQASFTLGELNGDNANVIWTVNGSTVAAGTYPAKAGTTYTAVAAATKGNAIDPSVTTTTFTFTPKAGAAGPCDLKTLALTGTGNPTGWIGLGYLLLVAGLGLGAVPLIRRRRTAE